MECVKDKIEGSTNSIINKLRSLDTLDGTVEELRKASRESQQLTDMVSPLSQNLTETEEHIMEEVNHLKKDISDLGKTVSEINEKLTAILSLPSTVDKLQINVNSIDEKINKASELINNQELKNREFYEKIMLALNIIKNLVTPFWKRKIDIEL